MGRLVVMSLRRVHDRGDVESLAFVVMPDHVHWLIRLGDRLLQNLMQDVKSYSGFHVKQSIQRHSEAIPVAIWQKSYHDHALRKEESVQDVARYIVMNPVRAGIVKSVREYPLWDAQCL